MVNFTGIGGGFPTPVAGGGSGDVVVRVTASVAQAERALRSFDLRMAAIDRRAVGLDLRFRRLDRIWTIIAAGSALALVGRFTKMIADMQSLQIQIGTFERDWDRVGMVMDRVLKLTARVPFTLSSMSRAFVRLKAAGLDPIVDAQGNGPLKDLADAVAAFGGGDEIFQRATIAIQQMAGKGVISMEELRQQLGEAVPLAMRLMASELDITVGKLIETVSRGNLDFQTGITAFFEGARKSFGGASELLVNTITGQALAFQKIWESLALRIDRSGIGAVMTAVFKSFNQTLEETLSRLELMDPQDIIDFFEKIAPRVDRVITTIGRFLSVIGTIAGTMASIIGSLPPEIVTGGLIGFIFAGRAGALVGALLATIDDIAPLFVNAVNNVENSIPDYILQWGLIGLLFAGKKFIVGGFAFLELSNWLSDTQAMMDAFIQTIITTIPEGGLLTVLIWGKAGKEGVFEEFQENIATFGKRFQENFEKARAFAAGEEGLVGKVFGSPAELKQAGEEAGDAAGEGFATAMSKRIQAAFESVFSGREQFKEFQATKDLLGLGPEFDKQIVKLASFLERLEIKANSVGSQSKRIMATSAAQIAVIDGFIDKLRTKLGQEGLTGIQKGALEAEIKGMEDLRGRIQFLTDDIVKQISGQTFASFESQAKRLGKALDVFLVGEGAGGGLNAVDVAVARVESRFAGFQLRIDQLTRAIEKGAESEEIRAAGLERLASIQEKHNEALERAKIQAEKTAIAQRKLNQARAEAAQNALVLQVNEIGLVNNLDKAAIAAGRAELRIVRMTDRIQGEIAKARQRLIKDAGDTQAQLLIDRYELLLKQIADSSDDFIERARFNASDWGILMNSIAESMERTFARSLEGLVNGTKNARDVLLDFYNEITRAVIRYLIEQAKVGLFGPGGGGGAGLGSLFSAFIPAGGFVGGAGGLDLFGSLAGLFGPGPGGLGAGQPFAGGGRPIVNRPVTVGEQGIETFVPDVPGTIIPGSRGGGVQIFITAVDASGVRDLFMREGSSLIDSLQNQARLGVFPNENT